MADESRDPPSRFSRRRLLRGAGYGAVALLGRGPTRVAAQQKVSQQVVAYQDHPDGNKRCDKCAHFEPPSGCKTVQGVISPEGSCRLFAPRQQASGAPTATREAHLVADGRTPRTG